MTLSGVEYVEVKGFYIMGSILSKALHTELVIKFSIKIRVGTIISQK